MGGGREAEGILGVPCVLAGSRCVRRRLETGGDGDGSRHRPRALWSPLPGEESPDPPRSSKIRARRTQDIWSSVSHLPSWAGESRQSQTAFQPVRRRARTCTHTHAHSHSTRPILHIPATWPYRALAFPAFLSRGSEDVVRQGTGGSPVDTLPGRGTGQPRQRAPGGFKSLGLRVAQAPGSAWSRSLLGQSGGLTRTSSPPPSPSIHTRTPQTPPQGAEALRSSLDPRSHNHGGRDSISQSCRAERAGTSAGRQIPYCQERRRGKKKGRGRKTGNSQESTWGWPVAASHAPCRALPADRKGEAAPISQVTVPRDPAGGHQPLSENGPAPPEVCACPEAHRLTLEEDAGT